MASIRWLARTGMAFAVAALVFAAAGPKPALAEEDDPIDVKVFRKVMRGLGLKRNEAHIEYRERSPLVVPPSRELPRPEDPNLAERNPAWPTDPDVKRRREAAAASSQRRSVDWDQEGRPLTPAELNKGAQIGRPVQPPHAQAKTAEESERQMSPSELGFKGYGNLRSLFGFEPKPEAGNFEREPARSDLTQPPPGYRTPSPNQPYGVSKSKRGGYGDLKPADPMDQPVGGSR